MTKQELEILVEETLGYQGRLLTSSKSFYREMNPDNEVYFNSNVCTVDGKIWYGDLDITLDSENLQKLAGKLNKKIYVLYEMDGRFENEQRPLLDRAVATFSPKETNTSVLKENLDFSEVLRDD